MRGMRGGLQIQSYFLFKVYSFRTLFEVRNR